MLVMDVQAKADGPLPKPHKSPSAKFGGSKKWKKFRQRFLTTQINDDGFYVCSMANGHGCGRWLQPDEVEVDHIVKRSVAPHLVYDFSNLQVLDHDCHRRKDGGMK